LLDAVKDRKARDTVRSVIEHLTNRKAVPEAAAPTAPAAEETSRTN
jgi:AsmA protein